MSDSIGNINDNPTAYRDNDVDASPAKNNGVDTTNIDLLMDVHLRVTVELGRTKMQLRQILELQHGSVIELDRLAGDPVDIYVNERLFAKGEVIVVDDKFGVRITDIIAS
jgi:flagellar motor switch protein FliN/FliY